MSIGGTSDAGNQFKEHNWNDSALKSGESMTMICTLYFKKMHTHLDVKHSNFSRRLSESPLLNVACDNCDYSLANKPRYKRQRKSVNPSSYTQVRVTFL